MELWLGVAWHPANKIDSMCKQNINRIALRASIK
jgi:hypothetical protein